MRAAAPDMMLILGNVSQMREIAKGADYRDGLIRCHHIQCRGKHVASRFVAGATKANGLLADTLDKVECRSACLCAYDVAEETPEETNIVVQGLLFFPCFRRCQLKAWAFDRAAFRSERDKSVDLWWAHPKN
jgi:hypothetical protein